MVRLIDSHAHLEDIRDLKNSLQRASEAGVAAIIAVGSNHDSNRFVLEVSSRSWGDLKVYPALGVHPWEISRGQVEEAVAFIKEKVNRAVGIGEVGLDYWYREVRENPEMMAKQRSLFRTFLKIAKRHDKPVIIHSRGAWNDCLNLVIEEDVKDAVFHWFTGPDNTLQRLLDHGYYVSATPAAEYSREHRRVIQKTPIENLLLETDSPVNYRGFEAEPADIIRSLHAVAKLKGISIEAVAEETSENASSLFNIDI